MWTYDKDHDMHHATDSNMDEVVSNVYGASNGPMMRAQVKWLQSALTSQITVIEASMSKLMEMVRLFFLPSIATWDVIFGGFSIFDFSCAFWSKFHISI